MAKGFINSIKNWKTTVAGLIIGLAALAAKIVETGDAPQDKSGWLAVLGAILMGVLGRDPDKK